VEAQTIVKREWFSYPEAERFAGLSRTTLWRLVGSGDVKAARVGRAVRISRRSLEEYMENQSFRYVGD
jgi:excisionase family DNA binding protein